MVLTVVINFNSVPPVNYDELYIVNPNGGVTQ